MSYLEFCMKLIFYVLGDFRDDVILYPVYI